jgi:hypothetical protein
VADFWVCPNEGKLQILKEIFTDGAAQERMVLAQFVSGGPVTNASTSSDFTLATYTGYANIEISRADWDAPAIAANIGSISKTTNPVFNCTGGSPQTVRGLLLFGLDTEVLYLGVNYATPIVMSDGTSDTITPLKIQDKTFA